MGGYNTLFGFAAFALLYLLLEAQLHYVAIALIANVLAITNAYLSYRYLVFHSTGPFLTEYLKSYIVYGGSAVIGIVLLIACVEVLGLHPILGQALTTTVTVVFSYFGHRNFTFKTRSSEEH